VVRAQAFKGLGEVRKALRTAVAQPEWKASIVKANLSGEASLIATVHDPNNQPVRGLAATSFIIKAGTPARAIRKYTAEEHDCRSSLNVAFVLCLPEQNPHVAEARFTKAIQACIGIRRSKDKWMIVKLNPNAAVRPERLRSDETETSVRNKFSILNVDYVGPSVPTQDLAKFEYVNLPQRVDGMLREQPITAGTDTNRLLIEHLLRVDIACTGPNIIFFGANNHAHLVPELLAKGKELNAAIHVCAETAAWDAPDVHQLVATTGGSLYKVSDQLEHPDRCFALYSSLLHHYRLTWSGTDTPESVELDVFSENGRASTSCEAQQRAA
jgi:hypothetical protein